MVDHTRDVSVMIDQIHDVVGPCGQGSVVFRPWWNGFTIDHQQDSRLLVIRHLSSCATYE